MTDYQKNVLLRRHEKACELKSRGEKLIGYLCAYCPEEIVRASGLTPVRIFGGPGPHPLADERLQDYYCAHARGCLQAGLSGDYDYLDGMVFPYTCLHTQGVYNSWAGQTVMPSWFIDMPSVADTPEALGFLVEELKTFQKSLEETFGVKISNQDLKEGIRSCNEERALLRKLYMLKGGKRPVVSGEKVFSLILENMSGAIGSEGLSSLLAELGSEEGMPEHKAQVMVLGTDLDDPRIFGAIERQGAVVVADNLCTGSRYIWQDVETQGDPLTAIAKRYLLGINCPLKHPLDLSLTVVLEMIDRFAVEKALFIWPHACDPMGWTVPALKKMLDQKGISHCWVQISGDAGDDDLALVEEAAALLIGG